MHGSRSKIPITKFVRQHCAEEFNSSIKGLNYTVYFVDGVTKSEEI
jgi:hypothetical protein